MLSLSKQPQEGKKVKKQTKKRHKDVDHSVVYLGEILEFIHLQEGKGALEEKL